MTSATDMWLLWLATIGHAVENQHEDDKNQFLSNATQTIVIELTWLLA